MPAAVVVVAMAGPSPGVSVPLLSRSLYRLMVTPPKPVSSPENAIAGDVVVLRAADVAGEQRHRTDGALGQAGEIDVEVISERRVGRGDRHADVLAGEHREQRAAGGNGDEIVVVGAAAGELITEGNDFGGQQCAAEPWIADDGAGDDQVAVNRSGIRLPELSMLTLIVKLRGVVMTCVAATALALYSSGEAVKAKLCVVAL